jgi:hypothetical protein
MDRGNLSKSEILEVLKKVSNLTTPDEPDSCPPSVNAILSGDVYSCFYGDAGIIRCTDSKEEVMTPDTAARIICNELSIGEYDLSKGHCSSSKSSLIFVIAVFIVITLAGIYIVSS